MDSAESLPPQHFYTYRTYGVNPATVLHSSVTKDASANISILLEEIRQGHEDAIQRVLADPMNSKDDLSIASCSPEELLAIARSWTVHTNPLSSFQFLIRAMDEVIGIAGFGMIRSHTDSDSVDPGLVGAAGVVINTNARGLGYGFEALRMVIDYGFRELKLDRVVIGTISRNTAMRRIMEKHFGMPATVTEPDRFGNDLEWSITRDKWAIWLTVFC